MQNYLDVFLNDYRVGTITNLNADHNAFAFDPSFVADDNRPTLSLGFLNDEGALYEIGRPPRVRLPPFFANLLPEGHLRHYLAQRARVNAQRDFPLLWLLGNDLPGAVIARHPSGTIVPGADDDDRIAVEAERDPNVLKFSLAGVQLKFSAVREADGGLTIPAHGRGGSWIVKLPSSTYPIVPENEYTMLTFARLVGIDVPEIGLVDAADIADMPPEVRTDLGNALYIRRFDRDRGRRIHTEDFAQIFSQYPRDKYKNVSYANMLGGIWRTMGEAQTAEFVRRLVFSIAIGNADMHLKNWSVVYADGKTPTLSPAYDYVSTILYLPNDKLALSIARTKEWADISEDLLVRFARRAAVPPGVVLNAARDMRDRILTELRHLDDADMLPKRYIATIDAHVRSIPLFSPRATAPGRSPEGASADVEPVEIT
ncbi:MAG TPA: HipA domain-containing protein [Candidatus Elarobacter sp.]|jgi:serine/threonine-protein kinase HipA|nr:HipA domain-containing protein [Candidatus Elarobacter sp.]